MLGCCRFFCLVLSCFCEFLDPFFRCLNEFPVIVSLGGWLKVVTMDGFAGQRSFLKKNFYQSLMQCLRCADSPKTINSIQSSIRTCNSFSSGFVFVPSVKDHKKNTKTIKKPHPQKHFHKNSTCTKHKNPPVKMALRVACVNFFSFHCPRARQSARSLERLKFHVRQPLGAAEWVRRKPFRVFRVFFFGVF